MRKKHRKSMAKALLQDHGCRDCDKFQDFSKVPPKFPHIEGRCIIKEFGDLPTPRYCKSWESTKWLEKVMEKRWGKLIAH